MKTCHCDSSTPYSECCGAIHDGTRVAETAEQLMRSRYCAYVEGKIEYLWGTLHPKAREGHDPDSARDWAENSKWLGLEVLGKEGGLADDNVGTVEFVARYERDDAVHEHHELAHFRRHEGQWVFEHGKVIGPKPTVREAPKIGRNDPCSCGSGKKFKKCCG